jgi:hypothetical protein
MADRFDLDAIDADDALLDLLAAGGESARSAGEHDPAIALLAELRLAVEVEDELPVEKIDDPESFLARCATLNPITDPFARKMATRGLAFGVAAVAALSVSGVAAAVNGDPLSPYEKVIEKMVDAVRPQTSFPKEDLDGLPAIDKTKIVKVAKDFQAKQQQEKAQQDKSDSLLDQEPAAKKVTLTPPLVQPRQELPVAIQVPELVAPVEPQEPAKTVVDPKTTDKTDQDKTTTDEPSTPTETTPPVDPTTPPPSETTTPPADPTTPPTDTTSTTDPTTPPPTTGQSETGNGSTSTGDPSNAPTEGTGTGSTGTDSTDTGSSNTGSSDPGSSNTGSSDTGSSNTGSSNTGSSDTGSSDTSSSDTGSSDTGTAGSTDTTSGLPADQSNDVPASDQPTALPTQSANALEKVVEQLRPVLPTPTGNAAENKSAERYFGDKHQAAGRHSTGALTEGSVKKSYTLGKHSTGHYAEGRHAAIHRAHGSTEDADVLKILGVVNKPTK